MDVAHPTLAVDQHRTRHRFDAEPGEDVLERLAEMAPREMRRAWMTAFGNAKLDKREQVLPRDLPEPGQRKSAIGFVQ